MNTQTHTTPALTEMQKRENQRKQILRHLASGKSIDQAQAIKKFRCFRLSARIYELRQAGHNISKQITDGGFAKYSLNTLF